MAHLFKVAPSQFGGTVYYSYDSAARVTSVTGSGFGTTTQFATAIQYRAWGSAKHAVYGDGATMNVTYNERLLPLRYELSNMKPNAGPATIMGSQNQYFADGRIKYTQDLQEGNFDRAYEYDHAGRIKEAYSGREARGLPVLPSPDNPFRQSYTYDVWDNMKRPLNRHWSANLPDTPAYTNNRRSDATYDAEGNVLLRDYERKQHAYDAAGRQRYFLQQEWGLPEYAYEANTIDVTFDGDGRPAKRFENRYTEDYELVPWNQSDTIYYVRSTVLGGAAIVEYMPVGYGTTENIYVGNQKLAERSPDSGYVEWRHVNPVTGSWLLSYPSGGSATTIRSELDPLGAAVGTANPYVSYTSYQDLMGLQSLYEERGNPFDPSGGCGTLDGLPISCSELRMRLQGGTVATEVLVAEMQPALEPLLKPRRDDQIVPPIQVLTLYRNVIVDQGVGLYMTVRPRFKGGLVPLDNNNEGYYLAWETGLIPQPQDTIPPETGAMDLSELRTILTASCAKFLNLILADLAKTRKPYSPSFMTIFNQADILGAYHTVKLSKEQLKKGLGGTSSIVGDPSLVIMVDVTNFNRVDNHGNPSYNAGYITIHETFHAAPASGPWYSHFEMAQAAYNVAVAQDLFKNQSLASPRRGTDEATDWYNAGIFDAVVRKGCPIPK